MDAYQELNGKVFKETAYYSAIIKNETMPIAATWMDLEIITLNEVSDKNKYHMISLVYVILKIIQINLLTKQK